jgi:hypothetical protein
MKRTSLLFAVFLLGIASRLGLASDLECPASVTVKQEIQAPLGWEAVARSSDQQLDRVAFYLKHPSLGGSLVPNATRRSKGEEQVGWAFVPNPGDEFWMGCIYQSTTVILARKLDKQISKCEVRYELLPSGSRLRVKRISCD